MSAVRQELSTLVLLSLAVLLNILAMAQLLM
jgi:hypothetical protein